VPVEKEEEMSKLYRGLHVEMPVIFYVLLTVHPCIFFLK